MKYAFVSGSSKGIGLQIGKDLLQIGYFVIFHCGRSESILPSLRSDLDAISQNYKILCGDFGSTEEVKRIIAGVLEISSRIDLLVLNAGTTDRTDFFDLSLDRWNYVLNVNLTAPFLLVQALGRNISEGGNIVFITSMLAKYPHAISVPYGVSKAGINALTKYLVKLFCEKKIRVNAVSPGFVETPWQRDKPAEIRKRIEDKIAIHRFASTSEISNTVLYIVDNGYINGSIIEVDGGYCYR